MAKDYNISKPACLCQGCSRQLQPGEKFTAALKEAATAGGDEYVREDYCQDCWPAWQGKLGADILGVWQSAVPQGKEKKKVFIDDDLLINFFNRLENADTPAGVNLRFVLALVLMRKKLLVYDKMEKLDDSQEIWLMRFKGSDEVQRVVNPRLDEQKIADVSMQLGQILEGEL
jgi:hypothetical protein